ncbi:MAG TPA: DUF4325 domain-containing protein [Lacibacter sp.]|nr:DUF4325 domain-containing protein [Lacibacter sp.]HMO88468.1 DUF4325 domain-containing protein [Lacibacter sp.]HMP86386.1 DUF4325 domain-containing protein [Lacibacter sp.]
MSVTRQLNKIHITSLDHPRIVSRFLFEVQEIIRRGYSEVEIDFSQIESVFPNAAVPVSGLIDYYQKQGISISRLDQAGIITSVHLLDPLVPRSRGEINSLNILNKVWRFTASEQVFWLVSAFMEELPKLDKFQEGVLTGLEWCINEVMDNVIQHSGESGGFVMGQIHKSTKHVAFTIFDYGIGIYNSLKGSNSEIRHPIDAITLCIQEGVTRDRKTHQGNGMYGLHQVVKFNEGRLTITSNNGSYFLRRDSALTFRKIPSISRERGCTTVDFQLDYDNIVPISEALKFNGQSYEMINLRLENMENNSGEIVYDLKNRANGYGTRQSGERVRNEIINIINEVNSLLIIDFSDIAVISSSFADEVVGKLVVEFGFFGFNNIIRLKNMNPFIQAIVQKAVSQRLAETLNS